MSQHNIKSAKVAAFLMPHDFEDSHDTVEAPHGNEDIQACYQDGPSWVDFLSPTNYQDGYFYYNMSTLCE